MSPQPTTAGTTASTTTDVVDALIGEGLLDPDARERGIAVVARSLSSTRSGTHDAAPTVPRETHATRALPQVVEVVAYLGGALVLAAGALFLVQQWDGLGFGSRVALLAAVVLVLAVAGVASARVPGGRPELYGEEHDTRRRLAGALLTAAALAAAFLAGLVVDELSGPSVGAIYWPAVGGALVGTLVAAAGYRVARTALGVVALMGGAITLVANVLSGLDDGGSGSVVLAVALVLLGALWALLAELGVFAEAMVARMTGVLVALFGAQFPVIEGTDAGAGYLLTALLGAAAIAAYFRTAAWPYLAAAVLSVTLVVPEAVTDWTDGSLGAVGGVLVAGVTLLLASLGGYRLRDSRGRGTR